MSEIVPPKRIRLATEDAFTPSTPNDSNMAASVISSSNVIVGEEIEVHPVDDDSEDVDSSDSDEDEDLMAQLLVRTQNYIASKYEPTFVETHAAHAASSTLTRQGIVIIQGRSGDGKTSLAVNLMKSLSDNSDWQSLVIASPTEWKEISFHYTGKRNVIFIDDIFGKSIMSPVLLEGWFPLFDLMISAVRNHRLRLIIATRDYILKGCRNKLGSGGLFVDDFIIDLGSLEHALTWNEKFQILKSHLDFCRVNLELPEWNRVAQHTSDLGFPQCCRYFSVSKDAQALGWEFFKYPLQCMSREIDVLCENNSLYYLVLVLIVLENRRLSMDDLSEVLVSPETVERISKIQQACGIKSVTSQDIWKACRELNGSFLSGLDIGQVEISHQSVSDAVWLSFGNKCPDLILEFCPLSFLTGHTSTPGVSLPADVLSVFISKEHFMDMIVRFLVELEMGNGHLMLHHRSFSDPSFTDILFKRSDVLQDFMKYFETPLAEPKFEVVQMRGIRRQNFDKVVLRYDSLLPHTLREHHYLLVKSILRCPLLSKDDSFVQRMKHQTMETAIFMAEKEMFQFVLSLEILPCSDCLKVACGAAKEDVEMFCAVKTYAAVDKSNIRMLSRLASHRGYIQILEILLTDVDRLLSRQVADADGPVSEANTDIGRGANASVVNVNKFLNEVVKDCLVDTCMKGDKKMYNILKPKCTKDQCDLNEMLCYASLGGNVDIIEDLLNLGADVTYEDRVFLKGTALMIATSQCHENVVKLLVRRGASITWKNKSGKSVLHATAEEGNSKAMEILLECGGNVTETDNDGWTPLHYAAVGESVDMVSLLIKHGADVTSKNRKDETPLHTALRGQVGHVQILLDNGAEVDARDKFGNTALLFAAAFGKPGKDSMKLLLQKGADVSVVNNYGETVLHFAAAGCKETVRLLLDRGLEIEAKDKFGQTPLHVACTEKGDCSTVKAFIERGADINCRDSDGDTPLLVVAGAKDQNLPKIKFLCLRGADLFAVNHFKENVVHKNALVPLDYPEILDFFLEKGLDATTQDKYGQTPLHKVCREGKLECAELLIKKGVKLDAKDKNGQTPLHQAAIAQDGVAVVSLFIDLGVDFCTPDKEGKTPLHKAASAGKVKTVKLLLEKGACVSVTNNFGDTPLHKSVFTGKVLTTRVLIDKGAIVDSRNNEGETPLHSAAAGGRKNTIEVLLEKGSDINLADCNGNTALHKAAACMFGKKAVLCLLRNGANITVVNAERKTPCDIAESEGFKDIIKLFRSFPACLEGSDYSSDGDSDDYDHFYDIDCGDSDDEDYHDTGSNDDDDDDDVDDDVNEQKHEMNEEEIEHERIIRKKEECIFEEETYEETLEYPIEEAETEPNDLEYRKIRCTPRKNSVMTSWL